MIKFVPYRCFGWGYGNLPEFNWVAYIILEDVCIFSGIELTERTSTVNAAEDIIENISKTEHIHWSQKRWFDFQGPWGYPLLRGDNYRFAYLSTEPASANSAEKSSSSLVIDGENIFVVVRTAKEVKVANWDFSGPQEKLQPVYDIFESCVAEIT